MTPRHTRHGARRSLRAPVFVLLASFGLAACSGGLERAPRVIDNPPEFDVVEYRIGPLDSISVNVWQAPEFSTGAVVRPDGIITLPLLEDIPAAGMTTMELARDLEERLAQFIQEPIVTVSVAGFAGPFERRVRVIREGSGIQLVSYRQEITLLDAMTEVGGLGPFDSGNRARLIRETEEGPKEYRIRLEDLVKDGDFSENVPIQPGDTIYIPEAWF